MDPITANVALVRERIARACRDAGRDPGSIRLLPVSKTKPAASIRSAYAAGCRRFGENKVQELVAKTADLSDLTELSWAFVGHLQSNKARQVAKFAAEFQALDSLPLAAELDRRLHAEGRQLDVLVEVNSSGEPSKFGLDPADVPAFARQLPAFDALRVRGLMTLALPSSDPAAVAACFERVVGVQRELRECAIEGLAWDELSMGMSGDLEIAIAHGATVVRVGQAIFGPRRPGLVLV